MDSLTQNLEATSAKNYKMLLIQEGVNDNQRSHMQKQDSSFYNKMMKEFEHSLEFLVIDEKDEMEIQMPPISQAKIPIEKEVLFGQTSKDKAPDAAEYQICSSGFPSQLKSKQKYDDEQAILNILANKPVTNILDKAYIKTMHQ